MEDILNKIVEHKRSELLNSNFADIESVAKSTTRQVISMSRSLRSHRGGIIAEFKRRSPSKGWINRDGAVADVVPGYYEAGAAACSVLTNEEFFGGTIEDLIAARAAAPELPILRKEFIVDPRQIYEARVAGADAVLLIAACLTVEECATLAAVAHGVGLEVLLEIHSAQELDHLNENIDMLGVNNRNLGTFVTDIENSFSLAEIMRQCGGDIVLVSESGLDGGDIIKRLQGVGFEGFLIGESFMKHEAPADSLRRLIEQL